VTKGLRSAVKRTIAGPPIWSLLGPLLGRHGVAILMYHRIVRGVSPFDGHDAEAFADQMRWLSTHCTPLHPRDLRAAIAAPRRRRPPVLVTFDDGYRDYHDVAYPILKSFGIPALVFLSTGPIDEGDLLWTDLVHLAVLRSPRVDVELPWPGGGRHSLGDAANRVFLAADCKRHLKRLPDAERQIVATRLMGNLGVDPVALCAERQMLTWDEVRATADLTTFGGHGHRHAILSRLAPPDLEQEIERCQQRIVAELGAPTDFFAFANGRPADFNAEVKHALMRHGFTTLFSTIAGVSGRQSDCSELRRLAAYGRGPDLAWTLCVAPHRTA
jgi:peptidoglycan/xylan/chitin deacetylase (PgdA/CDA1 family)